MRHNPFVETINVPEQFTFSRRSFLVMPLALAACKKGWNVLELSGLTMGTGYSIVAVDHTRNIDRAELSAAVDASFSDVIAQMSNWDAGSELSRFNAHRSTDAFTVSPELARVLKAAQDVHDGSDGRFDVTVGPLLDLWGFGAGSTRRDAPGDAEIADALACCGQGRSLEVQGAALRKLRPETEIYVSAIGKGHGIDRVAQTLADFGLTDYMVEVGGDLYTAGRNPDGQPWQIGIETPDAHDRGVMQVVSLSGMGMATSGDYRNFFEQDGVRYSHILDATTGRPVTHNTTSVTVMTDSAMLADAWATALLVLGRDRGLEIANDRDMAVLFLERGDAAGDVVTTASDRFTSLQA
ncbi:thiamine biosynthesis protein ApbE [Salipiger aestuarii]|uniref:FAD:protein FMN transferase n=2 Tax=Salipiger aestuarii TaxID=568098 RepID=A0A327Y2Y5_9RHOB|nr:ApbE-like lipoprotein [Citreicella sp. 357]KAA8606982.1 thiamine biosynthesis protein ApbE [Salipiger aestuarii]KAB2541511.1 thiamine biosynthesis protein ApbE [Salipiger aestuarii]RAK14115.1 thiamine biosynthesis lipoprotein [Salipiger aestuarii]